MSLTVAPDGLKPQEVERGNGRFNPPIPYIPEKHDELDPDRKPNTVKVTLSTGVESRAETWDGTGTKEQFLCHMMTMRETLGGMGLFLRHEEAEEKLRDETVKMQLEQESKQFADDAFAAAVTQQDKDKAKADVKKSAKTIKQIKDAIAAAEDRV